MSSEAWLYLSLAALAVWLLAGSGRGGATPGHSAVTSQGLGPVKFAGETWTPDRLARHVCVIGATGSGKTFSTNALLGELMRRGPMVLTCVKPDDCTRVHKIARDFGCEDRFIRLAPDSGERMNLVNELLKPNGSVVAAAHMLAKIGEVGSRYANANVGDNAFWVAQAERAISAAMVLNLKVEGKADVPLVHRTLLSTPSSTAELEKPEWKPDAKCERRRCANLIVRGSGMGLEDEPAFMNACEYLMHEMGGGGDRQRGGIIAQANVTLGPFIDPPWNTFFSSDSTIDPERIERERLIVALDMPEMTWRQPGQMGQAAITLAVQNYCLRRPFTPGTPITAIVRDEAPRIVTNDDTEALLVARSQGLCFIDLLQDVNALRGAFGGDKGKDAAWAFLQNHATTFIFQTTSLDTVNWVSSVVGQKLKIRLSGGGTARRHPQGTGDLLDDCLGVGGDVHWQQSWEPAIRPEWLAQSPVGVALMLTGGSHRWVDFRSLHRS